MYKITEIIGSILYKIDNNHEINRLFKGAVSITFTALVVFAQNDPNPWVSGFIFLVVDRLRGYIFRKLNIDY